MFRKFILLLPLLMLVGACAEIKLATHTVKKITNTVTKTSKGPYKMGKPYQIKGIWYYPAVNYGYVEKGVASWYGPQFHGRKTANGEIFDMNTVSAAHRTLPMPSIVRVTNLENGRAMNIRVNDRGPFAKNRIIDLSRRAAQLLGFKHAGTALVKVEIIADESRRIAMLAQKNKTFFAKGRREDVRVVKLGGKQNVGSRIHKKPQPQSKKFMKDLDHKNATNVVTLVPIPKTKRIFVQAGAFVYRDLAEKMQKLLDPLGPTRVVEAIIGKRRYFRVQVGPAPNVKQGDKLLNEVIASGYPTAKLIVE